MKPKRVLLIDPAARTVTEATVSRLEDMQKIVGGRIERARICECGHEVYVNEEGLFNDELVPFMIDGAGPFVGPAFVIGPVTPTGDNRPATLSVEEVRKMIRWMLL